MYILAGISPGMHVLDSINLGEDSGTINSEDKQDSSAAINNSKVLILLLEQEILFIELTLPQYVYKYSYVCGLIFYCIMLQTSSSSASILVFNTQFSSEMLAGIQGHS